MERLIQNWNAVIGLLAASLWLVSAHAASANTLVDEIVFDSETISIIETDEFEKVIMLRDRELGRNWFAGFDRVANVSGEPVALFYLGDGGNACGPSTLIVWRNDNGNIETLNYQDGCDTPAPSISDNGIHFVPYLNPGQERPLKRWSKNGGIETVGLIRFTPEPGTGWDSLTAEPITHPTDFFLNEAVYALAANLLGGDMQAYTMGLSVASEPQRLPSGMLMASGCVPHSCGSNDAFIAIDTNARALYMAQQNDNGYSFWPAYATWPQTATQAFGMFRSNR